VTFSSLLTEVVFSFVPFFSFWRVHGQLEPLHSIATTSLITFSSIVSCIDCGVRAMTQTWVECVIQWKTKVLI